MVLGSSEATVARDLVAPVSSNLDPFTDPTEDMGMGPGALPIAGFSRFPATPCATASVAHRILTVLGALQSQSCRPIAFLRVGEESKRSWDRGR